MGVFGVGVWVRVGVWVEVEVGDCACAGEVGDYLV